ncbi:hypothetical protein BATDEDRAFT_25149 [Batrachochytrium dendrobatidis JAM81]|uniref:Uncharacterized protein n=1 Tax=Batrachochytrium dendrobatidis (strain JAM81 / FGSC 10211) TaxID=684364 RepID=F4P2X1_BATDJ|nr:uncharacterized protein BATDEDRAFT_25149 [Batrachochytrium dendrobatidis JAM81]EGF80510.1 hypothetical protein BATDEDRAFT_25149 [Batrachochytrium dendrobatidis JAM81]|eukprot:XP_006679037.1 hypothetical protein BATDEDRAFT_25149 [Batrachochytrium dendrobatidis JAM81]
MSRKLLVVHYCYLSGPIENLIFLFTYCVVHLDVSLYANEQTQNEIEFSSSSPTPTSRVVLKAITSKFCDLPVERSTNGVVLGKMDGWIESHEQEVDHWDGLEISFSKILEFTRYESSMDYNFVGKNCKHFCYDFRRNVLGKVEDFGTYCQFIESKMNS